MKVAVVGTGYVGLVTGTCLADCGHDVICVDIDEKKVAQLEKGDIPIYEPGLEELVLRNQEENRLSFTTDLKDAVARSAVLFIAVGTPPAEDGSADLRHVLGVAKSIGETMTDKKIVVVKSTVPPGSAEKVRQTLAETTEVPFAVISNPEFLKEGAAIDDFSRPDRVVIGGSDPDAIEAMKDLYSPFVRTGNPIVVMDNVSAEMTKYAANAMLATRISFMNEIANLCERTGADVDRVRESIGLDKRIGHPFLFPGAGYGGSCFPKDVQALVRTGRELGFPMRILEAVEDVNAQQKGVLFEKIKSHFGADLRDRKIAVWGLAFKPKTDDMREAPALTLIEKLLNEGCRVSAYDPEAMANARNILGDRIEFVERNYDACEGADGLAIVTEWNEFRRPDFERLKDLLKERVIFDGRNLFNPERVREQGFTYYSIGRPPVVLS
ncbi:MAG: UDP-glucose/GDP-mannose dehydrogenase family protein [Candidatus Omnitrophica bacterium]|nr:UDP-glucose/GDP-mannose dehydrogenase family protein [Candidatus Omnitrophota bacterium]MCB9783461.1 UDP-glucose/GDP-mannose dehydrogenase family protein [Candidatus Omnitrophota bacterium]